MARNALVSLVRAAIVAAAAFAIATGCSRQAEGERCDFFNAGDQDCDDGLVCTKCGDLQQQSIDRCCRPGDTYTDTRCIRAPNKSDKVCSGNEVGKGGSGGSSSTTGGTAGMSTGGVSAGGMSAGGTSSDTGGTTDVAGGAGAPAAGTGG